MKKNVLRVAILMGCILLVAGCGGGGGPTKKADTPEQALANMRLAVLDGDKDALVNCFEATAKQKEMLEAFSEFTIAASKFEQKMKKVYGEEAVKQAMSSRKQGMQLDDENWLDEVKIKTKGDTATAVRKGESQVWHLVKKDGVWKIDVTSMMVMGKGESDKDIEQATKMFQTMVKVVNDVKPKIGQAGYTAKKVNDELSQAMMMAMMQSAGAKGLLLPKP